MDSKVEDGEDSDMEDMAYMEEKKWKIGDSEELIRGTGDQQDISSVGKTAETGA